MRYDTLKAQQGRYEWVFDRYTGKYTRGWVPDDIAPEIDYLELARGIDEAQEQERQRLEAARIEGYSRFFASPEWAAMTFKQQCAVIRRLRLARVEFPLTYSNIDAVIGKKLKRPLTVRTRPRHQAQLAA